MDENWKDDTGVLLKLHSLRRYAQYGGRLCFISRNFKPGSEYLNPSDIKAVLDYIDELERQVGQ